MSLRVSSSRRAIVRKTKMIVSDNFIYLQMQKTGCTFVANELRVSDSGISHGKHNTIKSKPTDKLVVCSVRNPWDWYVSLWAYGCMKKGTLFEALTKNRTASMALKNWVKTIYANRLLPGRLPNSALSTSGEPDFRRLYSDPSAKENFRTWLKAICANQTLPLMPQRYWASPVSRFGGLMTYRFIRLAVPISAWKSQIRTVKSYQDLKHFYDFNSALDVVLKQEQLDLDLRNMLITAGVKPSEALSTDESKANSSVRDSYQSYYDEETMRLVSEKERFIISNFEYSYDATQLAK